MKRDLRIAGLLLLGLLLIAAGRPRQAFVHLGAKITNQGLDAARSMTIANTHGWGLATIWVKLTDANDSVTDLTMVCTASHDKGTTDYTIQDCQMSSGRCTSEDQDWLKDASAVSGSENWPWRVDIEGFQHIECTFTDPGGVSADKLDVEVSLATKG